ncbi:3055_t:CDS:2 [Paraglomus occultum]|uniref:3055_t:CDS:1 n=1 Tax=Paraglomus occultum TaxID=144539 RepID=A0A9N9B706_9GLOM|nr:3055_t:CDS:2 [Paraglomus occultum]
MSTGKQESKPRPTSLPILGPPQYTEIDPEGNAISRTFTIASPGSPTPRRFYKKPSKPRDFATSAKKRQSVLALGSITHLQHFYAKKGIIIQPKKLKQHAENILQINVTDLLQVTEEPEDFPPTPLPPSPPPLPAFLTTKLDVETDPEVLLAQCHIDIHEMLNAWHIVTGDAQEDEESVLVDILAVMETTTKAIQSVKNYSMHKEDLSPESLSKIRAATLDVLDMLDKIEKTYREEDDSSSEDGHIYKESYYRSLDTERQTLRKYLKVVEEYLLFNHDEETAYAEGGLANEEKRDSGIATLTPPASPGYQSWDWVNPELFKDESVGRYHSFLEAHRPSKSKHLPNYTPLPDPRTDKTEFLAALSDGKLLCNIYNTVVRRSKRPFGFIEKIHDDTSRTYRASENLKFFAAACKFRFDIKFEAFDTLAIVKMTDIGRVHLEEAIKAFCEKAMDELITTGAYKSSPLSRVSSIYLLDSASSSRTSLSLNQFNLGPNENELTNAFASSMHIRDESTK